MDLRDFRMRRWPWSKVLQVVLAALVVLSAGTWAGAEPPRHRQLTEATWSPDGQRAALVFSAVQPGGEEPRAELLLVDRQGRSTRLPVEAPRIRLLGWSRDGVVYEGHPGDVAIQPATGGPARHLRLPEGAVPLAGDGDRVYYLSEDRMHLLSLDASGQNEIRVALPPGIRPPGTLSPDGHRMVLRRALPAGKGAGRRWATELWVVEDGVPARAGRIESSTVRVAWHPTRNALLVNAPEGGLAWKAWILSRRAGRWDLAALPGELPSPLQWDRAGLLYAADGRGLVRVGPVLRRVRDWGEGSGRLAVWALSPEGEQVLAGLDQAGADTSVLLLPLPTGAPRPVEAALSGLRVGRR